MNPLDLAVIGIVALSAIFAFARGFVREALSIIAWVGAAAITLYGFNWVYGQIEPPSSLSILGGSTMAGAGGRRSRLESPLRARLRRTGFASST